MKHRGFRFASPVLIAAAVGGICWVNAGQLSPPAGAIMATGPIAINGQDVNNSLPYTISSPGSYIFTSNIVAPSSHTGDGIVIASSDVTLDLNGFGLIGGAGSVNGILVSGSRSNIVIRNGLIRTWNGVGIEAFTLGGARFEDLRLANNTVAGLRLNEGSTITGCSASKNGIGMVVDGCTVIGCAFARNTEIGIAASGGSVITDCVASENGDGFGADGGTLINGCAAQLNLGHGFILDAENQPGKASQITNSTAVSNTGDGIHLTRDGIVMNCTARQNGGNGIFALSGAIVSGCMVGANAFGDGIQVGDHCRVVGNHCYQNGLESEGQDGAGIHSTGTHNYIEGNVVTGNGRGIAVDSTASFIFKNSAMANILNYDIGNTNAFGPIVNILGVGDISGTTNADHPWANFEE